MKLKLYYNPSKDFLFLHLVDQNTIIPLRKDAIDELQNYGNKVKIKVVENDHLQTIQWHITRKCNLSCVYCYVDAKENAEGFTREEALKLIDESEDIGVLSFNITGGEPLLVPYLKELIEYIYERGMAIGGIFTNGTLLNYDIIRLCEKYTLTFFVSLDGLNSNYILRKSDYNKVVKTIKEMKKYNCYVRINTLVTKYNYNEILKLYDILTMLKVDGWRISTVFPHGRGAKYYYDLYIDINDELKLYYEILKKYLSDNMSFDLELGNVVRILDGVVWMEKYSDTSLACWYFSNQIVIWPDGRVTPCTWLSINLGNVKKESLRDIWQRAIKYKKIRINELKACSNCPLLYMCGGGCRARALLNRESIFEKDEQACKTYNNELFLLIQNLIKNSNNKVRVIDVPSEISEI